MTLADAVAITPDATLPLTVVWGIASAVAVGTAAAVGIWYRIGALTKLLRGITVNAWTVSDHKHWSTQLRDRNKHLHVPDVEKIVPVDAQGED